MHCISLSRGALVAALALAAAAVPAIAQSTGSIEGTVITARDGAPVGDATVYLEGQMHGAVTDARGRFRLTGVPAGTHSLVVQRIGYRRWSGDVSVAAGVTRRLDIALSEEAALIEGTTVTASRGREEKLKDLPATVSVLSGEEIEEMRPTHIAESLNRLAGVHVVAFDGADSHNAVRYPLGYKATFLLMEDGIPFAPPSFYVPALIGAVDFANTGRVEAMKGPGTAAYGMDAVTGVLNFVTAAPPLTPEADITLEGGPHEYRRAMLSAGGTFGRHGLRVTGGFADTDGRNSDPSRRISGSVRWDTDPGNGALLRTIVSYNRRDARMAGGQDPDQFANRVFFNPYPVAYDRWRNFRASTSYQQSIGRNAFSVTPYFRYQNSDRVPSWMLSYDPVIWDVDFKSVGLLAQFRRELGVLNGELTAGLDGDYSPLDRRVPVVTPVEENGQWVAMSTEGEPHYDYRATYRGAAAYGQLEFDPVPRLRVSAGVRFDIAGYDYHTRLPAVQTGDFRRPADTTLQYRKLTPKLGITYSISDESKVYASYRRGYRVPTEDQLFSQGSSASTVTIQPVEVEATEVGVRTGNSRARIEIAAYYMELHNDILSYRATSGVSALTNNGESSHRGIEISGGLAITSELRADVALTFARHQYEKWRPSSELDFSGKEMNAAPRRMVNGTLTWEPRVMNGGRVQLEWMGMGSYLLDPTASFRFDGYEVLNLRASYVVADHAELFVRVMNVTDETYAVEAFTGYGPIPWTANPGEYRSLYAGVKAGLW